MNHPNGSRIVLDRARRLPRGGALVPLPLAAAIPFLLIILAGGCARDHQVKAIVNPNDPRLTGITPPTPTAVTADVGNRSVDLRWELADSTDVLEIRSYRLYRRTLTESQPVLADSAARPPARIRGLVNNTGYKFSVATVLKNGLEGIRSDEVTAFPAAFGVQIEGGRERVGTTAVRLGFVAPQGTSGVQVSNSPDPSTEPVAPYTGNQSWDLTSGDGTKTVYARFLDAEGNGSETVSDDVILDTHANIASITFSPESVAPGGTIHFELNAGEPGGAAQVQLGSGGRTLRLQDDGQDGDLVAQNGIYSLDYRAEDDLDIIDAVVTARFTDQAGNAADSRIAPARLTVHRAPDAVTLEPVVSSGAGELFLSWSQATDPARFSSYRVLRAETAQVYTDPNRRLVKEVTSRTQTTTTETGLDPQKTYWYGIEVLDPNGFSARSNIQSGRPLATDSPDTPPGAVTLNAPTSIGETSILLNWSRNADLDFARYELHRYTEEGADVTAATITTKETTSFLDQNLADNTNYTYRVFVFDLGGHSTGSNESKVKTLNADPPAVALDPAADTGDSLATPTVRLAWGISNAHDFQEYRLYRDTSPAVGEGATLVRTVVDRRMADPNRIRYLDGGLTDNTRYYYRVFVHDDAGAKTGSNEVTIVTANRPPAPVTLTATDSTRTSISLSWTESAVSDFDEYKIMQLPFSGDYTNFHEVGSRTERAQTTFTRYYSAGDTTRYFFKVVVFDQPLLAGPRLSAESNVVSARVRR